MILRSFPSLTRRLWRRFGARWCIESSQEPHFKNTRRVLPFRSAYTPFMHSRQNPKLTKRECTVLSHCFEVRRNIPIVRLGEWTRLCFVLFATLLPQPREECFGGGVTVITHGYGGN